MDWVMEKNQQGRVLKLGIYFLAISIRVKAHGLEVCIMPPRAGTAIMGTRKTKRVTSSSGDFKPSRIWRKRGLG